MRGDWFRTALITIVCAGLICAAGAVNAAVFTVTTAEDAVDAAPGDGVCETAAGNGVCTLRAAVQETNALAGLHTVTLPAGTYVLTLQGANEELAATGDLDIRRVDPNIVTLLGDGDGVTAIDGGGTDRVLDVIDGSIDIFGVTIRNGSAADGGCVAVGATGDLSMDSSTITTCTASNEGGGLDNKGLVTLTQVRISDCTGQAGGGGVSTSALGVTTLIEVIISNNTAPGDGGGGINNKGDTLIDTGSVSGNIGRGINNTGAGAILFLENVTISGNTADNGAGIRSDGTVDMFNVTIADNAATVEGGGFLNSGSAATIFNTVLSNNTPQNCAGAGTVTSEDNNIDSGSSCGFVGADDIINSDPLLGPLQDNGGFVPTRDLQTGSPALDAADPLQCPFSDARSFPRPLDGNGVPPAVCDIGAYELCRAVFNDVTPGSTFDVYIQGLSCNQITTGCNPEGTSFCPTNNVTRQAMAAFIIRALFGENFLFTQTPYFTDVPATNQFFKYIQKMRDEGITTGCNLAGTQYCPTNTVTRRAMSAFIIRALFGENFFFTPTPFFTDVPDTDQFFKYIQRMKDEAITTGCNPPDNTQYCPADNVTRQAMAAFIGRGFLSIP